MKIFTRLKFLQSYLLLSRDKSNTNSLNNGVFSEMTLNNSKIYYKMNVDKSFHGRSLNCVEVVLFVMSKPLSTVSVIVLR